MIERETTAPAAYVRGIGVLGPGIWDWPSAAALLKGERPYVPAPTEAPPPAALPAAERRRTGATVRLALAAGLEALDAAGLAAGAAETLATVFASSSGDGEILHEICSALASPERQISPTRFHNSVHNAASGYWSIALRAMAPSTALSAYDGSFAAGLIEALCQIGASGAPALLVAYDTDYPEPLREKRPLPGSFAAALLLDPRSPAGALARLEVRPSREVADRLPEGPLEALRAGIPAARSLPLLNRICRRDSGRAVLDYLDGLTLAVNVCPCP
jgi:hypothetical protein